MNMSDDEDNQSLLDEIKALEYVLDQKENLNSHERASTSGILQKNVLPKVETKFEKEQNEIMESDIMDEDEDEDEDGGGDGDRDEDEESMIIDDCYDNYNCTDLQDLLEFNKKLIESLLRTRSKMESLLEECMKKQSIIADQISNKCTAVTQAKIIIFNAGMPYFKDKNYFTPKRNEDTETKMRNGELRLTELQRIHRWNQLDKVNLLKAVRYEVTSKKLKKDDVDEVYINNSITKTSQLPSDVKEAIGSLGSMNFDWLKIANNICENKHSAEECEVMWNVFLHPDINKQKWTAKEDKDLNRIVEEYNFEDWDSIAKDLNTKRSGYQCFVRYNTNNWKNLMKGQSWSPTDDKTLIYLVEKLKIGDYIPWGYISSCMNSWTKQQVYFRWSYSLAPHLKKGRFSSEEDKMLLNAVEKYGPNFSRISTLVMTHRTYIQLKEHYQTLIYRKHQFKKIWTLDEDAELLKLYGKYGSNWAKIVKEMRDVTRVQARQRFASLQRYKKKGIIDLEQINRDKKPEDPLSTHTTVTYINTSPWSRENKEIYVKHLKIDDQLVNFFKRENAIKRMEEKRKSYHPDRLKEDTKKLHDILLKFNAHLNIPDYIEDNYFLNENQIILLKSLQNYIEKHKGKFSEEIENVRLKMFGPQEPVPNNQRFIPPLPFGFCNPRYKLKTSNVIDCSPNFNKVHQVELIMELQPDKQVAEYLGEDIEQEFEKLKKMIVIQNTLKPPKELYGIKCKPFARSLLLEEENNEEDVEEINTSNEEAPSKNKVKYDWESNRMVSNNTSNENIIMNTVPVPIIEPNKTTLRAFQELLLISGNFLVEPSETNSKSKLTPRGRAALYLFKRRYKQLFSMPLGLSRIIPPDVVDESAFLPVLEKFKINNLKRKRSKNVNKDTRHAILDE